MVTGDRSDSICAEHFPLEAKANNPAALLFLGRAKPLPKLQYTIIMIRRRKRCRSRAVSDADGTSCLQLVEREGVGPVLVSSSPANHDDHPSASSDIRRSTFLTRCSSSTRPLFSFLLMLYSSSFITTTTNTVRGFTHIPLFAAVTRQQEGAHHQPRRQHFGGSVDHDGALLWAQTKRVASSSSSSGDHQQQQRRQQQQKEKQQQQPKNATVSSSSSSSPLDPAATPSSSSSSSDKEQERSSSPRNNVKPTSNQSKVQNKKPEEEDVVVSLEEEEEVMVNGTTAATVVTQKSNATIIVETPPLPSISTKKPKRDDESSSRQHQAEQNEEESASKSEKNNKTNSGTYSARFLADNGLKIQADESGRVTARPPSMTASTKSEQQRQQHQQQQKRGLTILKEQPAVPVPKSGFNVVLTHCTADFDSLASAVGLAKLWSSEAEAHEEPEVAASSNNDTTVASDFDSASNVPTFVVLPRGAHPGVQRFLGLHKHLFPIRSLKSLLQSDHLGSLNRLALVDAQRRDRLGPADQLLPHANRITVVDHHVDQDSDIEADDYVVDRVGSVSTLIVERLQEAAAANNVHLSEAEATLLALGIHADTGSLCFDSTTVRDAAALTWCLGQGASQAAIAEHAQSSLSPEQQGVLTQALVNANTTQVHGVTVSTVLLSADGFINGLAAVTQDALELSSSDIFLLGLVYEAKSGSGSRGKSKKKMATAHLLSKEHMAQQNNRDNDSLEAASVLYAEAWQGGEEALRRRRLRAAFDRTDKDQSGFLDEAEVSASLASAGVIALGETVKELIAQIDDDGDGKIDFEEFVVFATEAEKRQQERNKQRGRKATTMIIIGRVKAGVNLKAVKLNQLLAQFGGGGHPKASSATVRLNDQSEAEGILQALIDELIETSLQEQPTVGDFMTAPVLSVKPDMTEKQVEDLFTRYDVRALPVVDDSNDVIGLVSYSLVAAAKQRLWNKEQKRLRREREAKEQGKEIPSVDEKVAAERGRGTTVKGWMLQHVQTVEADKTMAQVESVLLENDIGCIPVVAPGTKQLVGMVTRTDLLRQHRYYPNLPYHNKGYADSIAARKPIIELRKRLKKFDLDE